MSASPSHRRAEEDGGRPSSSQEDEEPNRGSTMLHKTNKIRKDEPVNGSVVVDPEVVVLTDSLCSKEDEIVVVSDLTANNKAQFVIESDTGQKTKVQVTIERGGKGWVFGRALTTGIDMLACGEGDKFIGIRDPKTSQSHCKIWRSDKDGCLYITDVGSRNGTKVNGESVWPKEERLLKHSEVITVGASKIRLIPAETEQSERVIAGDKRTNNNEEKDGFMTLTKAVQEDMMSCFFCQLNLANFSIVERSLHINACAEGVKGNDEIIAKEVAEGADGHIILSVCMVCGKSLDKHSEVQRTTHINQCLDKQQEPQARKRTVTSLASNKKTSNGATRSSNIAATSINGKNKATKASGIVSANVSTAAAVVPTSVTASAPPTNASTVTNNELRFTFTKQNSAVIADELHEFNSDNDDVFEENPKMKAEKKRLQEELLEVLGEDAVKSKRLKNLQSDHSRKERSIREVLLPLRANTSKSLSSPSSEPLPPGTRSSKLHFPSPLQFQTRALSKIRMTREALLRRKTYYAAQLEFVNELLSLEDAKLGKSEMTPEKTSSADPETLWEVSKKLNVPSLNQAGESHDHESPKSNVELSAKSVDESTPKSMDESDVELSASQSTGPKSKSFAWAAVLEGKAEKDEQWRFQINELRKSCENESEDLDKRRAAKLLVMHSEEVPSRESEHIVTLVPDNL